MTNSRSSSKLECSLYGTLYWIMDPRCVRLVALACFLAASNVHPVGLNATTVSYLFL